MKYPIYYNFLIFIINIYIEYNIKYRIKVKLMKLF